jgi:hypothetical protein
LKDWSALNIMPSLSETLQRAEIVEGDVLFDMSFNQSTPLRIGLEVPRSRFLHVQAQDSTIVATNLGPLSVQLRGDELSIERMVVKAAQQKLALCGLYDLTNQTVRMDIAGALRLDKLTGLKVILPDLEGRLITAPRENQRVAQFDDSCLQRVINPRTRRALGNPKGYLRLTDSIYNPAIRGALRFNDVRATPRGLGEIALQSGVLHLERAADGQQRLFVPMEAPLNGSFDEGTFRLHGEAALPQVAKRTRIEDWLPNKGWVDLKGEELYWSEPNEYNITVDPTVRLTFDHLSDEVEKAKLDLSGRIDLPEGEYFKNLSFFARTVGNILSRSVDAYSVSITEQYPALNDLGLALEVEGNNFTVRSDAGFVYTDLETAMKLRVEGTLGDPLVTGYIEVTDGTVTYRPVRREFEVNRGRISFSGDPTRPELDFEGETVIEGAGTQLSNRDTEDIVITLRLSGTPPDDLHPEFESKPSLPQTDIQFLILAGRTRADLETGGFQTTSTLDLFSANLADFVTNLIKAPFVESLDVVPLTDGSVGVGGQFRFGRFIRLGVTGRQQDGATTYDARYVHRIRDDLILEAIRRGPSENSQDRERYEVRLKYTVTLD